MSKHFRAIPRIPLGMAALIMLCAIMISTCYAGTLYERSLENFSSRAQKASPHDFTFVVLGDSRDNDEVFKKALALAATFNPLFILHEGDFSRDGSREEVAHFLEAVDGAVPALPLFVVPGNHEQKKPFEEKIGPLSYVIENERLGFKLVVIDNSDYKLQAPQLSYLKDQLAAKRTFMFVAMHVPPSTKKWNWHTFEEGAAELIGILTENKVTAAFYGHLHLYAQDEIKGVPHIITGGAGASLVRFGFPGDASYHIVVVRVKEGVMSYKMVKIPE